MQLDIDKINKLPPDVRKRVQKLLIKYKEEDKKNLHRMTFLHLLKLFGLNLVKVSITKQLQINLTN